LRHVHRVEHLAPRGSELAALDRESHQRLPRWVGALSMPRSDLCEALAAVAASPDRMARLLALRELIALNDEQADEQIAAMCFDANPAIARIALRHLLRRRWRGLSQIMVRLIGSANQELRQIVERQLGPIGFERFWRNWPTIAPATRTAAGRALMKIDPSFAKLLSRRMQSEIADDRLRAVMIVRELGQETQFESQLLARARDSDERVASAAVKALSAFGSSRPIVDALTESLDHTDDRVRSNAVEALEAIGHVKPVADSLAALAEDGANRSRATAIKALLELPMSQALPQLERMLADGDDHHRVSALWVVEKMGLLPVVHRVASLAQHDPEPRVRRRAVRVVRDLAAAHLAQQKGSA